MNKLIIIFLVILNIACAKKEYKSLEEATPIFLNEFNRVNARKIIGEPYKINFKIEKSEDNGYSLITAVELIEEGSHFVSPFSTGNSTGKFNISIEDNPNLTMASIFTETPRTVEEFDPHPFVNGYVNWVKENTTYRHQLSISTKEDFEVTGLLRFVIEPRCTLEEINFTISYHDGELHIKKSA
jgi:hypothetical protein